MKNKIILFLILSTLILLFLYFGKDTDEVVKVTTKYDTITKIIDNTKPTKIRKIYIKIPKIIEKNTNSIDTVYINKEIKKYTYKDTLKNGIIHETIISDKIYSRKVKLTTFDKTKTIEKIRYKSVFYVGGGVTSDFNKNALNFTLNGYYVYKNKFLLGTGIGYDINTKKPIINMQFAIKF